MTSWADADLWTQTRIVGGSLDKLHTDVAISPAGIPFSMVVMAVTQLVKRAIASLNSWSVVSVLIGTPPIKRAATAFAVASARFLAKSQGLQSKVPTQRACLIIRAEQSPLTKL